MTSQLALNLRLSDSASFSNFLRTTNAETVGRLERNLSALATQRAALDPVVFLVGATGTGKSHLLQASCHVAYAQGAEPMYVPLGERAAITPAVLDGDDCPMLVCVDDVDRVAGNPAWERGLLALWERVRAGHGLIVAAARVAPANLGCALADLASRLAAGPVYTLHTLADHEKLEAIRLRAGNRGLEISEEVARYIVSRYPRDLHSLFELLDRLDERSLASRRRITIPFLRELERG